MQDRDLEDVIRRIDDDGVDLNEDIYEVTKLLVFS